MAYVARWQESHMVPLLKCTGSTRAATNFMSLLIDDNIIKQKEKKTKYLKYTNLKVQIIFYNANLQAQGYLTILLPHNYW